MEKHPPRQNGARRYRASSRVKITVLDYFNLGLQRGRHAVALPVVGDVTRGSTGLTVRYQLRVEHGIIQQVSFKASTCVALVAYCEMLAQWATEMPLREAICIRVEVVAMFFFEDNNYVLMKGNPIGERLHAVAKRNGILLMGCDQCCYEREIADRLLDGVPIGCFPDLYAALADNMPDQVITL